MSARWVWERFCGLCCAACVVLGLYGWLEHDDVFALGTGCLSAAAVLVQVGSEAIDRRRSMR